MFSEINIGYRFYLLIFAETGSANTGSVKETKITS